MMVAVILSVIALVFIHVQDVIIAFHLSWKTIIIFLGAILAPFLAAYLFRAMHTQKPLK